MSKYVENRDGGYWIIGKRISLDSVVYAYWQGQSAESIRQSFPLLTLEEIHGGIAFYLANQEAVDKSILEDDVEFEKEVLAQRATNPDWYAKMDRARAEIMLQPR